MGIALSLMSMLGFASNILLTRYAMTRMSVEAGFFVVLATNIVFPVVLLGFESMLRAAPFAWHWKAAGLFALGGVIGTFLGRRLLFDTVRLLGPSRASVFHSTAPAFALIGAWLLADERLGRYEIGLMALIWLGLWLTQPRRRTAAHASALAPASLRKGMLLGLLTVAGFGFGSVFRGLAMRDWDEAIVGTLLASSAALACQVAATREWGKVAAELRHADRVALWLYAGCGIATSLGAIFMSLAMRHMEIALSTLVVHTTPLVIFPVSVFILKNREELTPRTLLGAFMVLAGIAFLALK
jgi:drug/metabolite transporter (DMT)-like permease